MLRVILEGLVKRYGSISAVDEASLELRPGGINYVLGPSGAGKTTLARLVAGLETPDDGEIFFGDRLVQAVAPHDRGVGMVFQNLGLWPGLTVLENVAYPLQARKLTRQERRQRIAETMTALRIDSLAGRRPEQLTQPQRIRTALARAMVTQPELLILDEPLGGLTPRAREECWEDLRRVHAEASITTLVLTSDADEALALANHLAVMDLGRIVQVGPTYELYNRPADVFVARLLGPTNLLQGQVDSQGVDLRGEVVVRTPLGRLIGRSGPGTPGQGAPVTISVRPETLAVTTTVPSGWNRFPATIEGITFRGALRQIQARGPNDWPILVSVLQSQSQGLREGQSLTLSVAPEHVVVLPGKFALGGASRVAGGADFS
jgi:ABC-type Fe3+/spermidine/putrescine transport system ATPase subunit